MNCRAGKYTGINATRITKLQVPQLRRGLRRTALRRALGLMRRPDSEEDALWFSRPSCLTALPASSHRAAATPEQQQQQQQPPQPRRD
ncbi:hypothetical protein O3P69_009960 [Scylla paramamosain]|uniref:Uncharacterized protein n=1 Tax=Scylla paramamosain TaxID=85552 RepID=A0AAW0SMS4_SCYPA